MATPYRRKPHHRVGGLVARPKRKGPPTRARVDDGQAITVFEKVPTEVPDPKRLLSLHQAAAVSRISFYKLKDRVARGVAASVRIGRSVRVRLSEVD